MQRVVVVIGCIAVGGLAIYGAVKALNDKPGVAASERGGQSEEGPLQSSVVRIADSEYRPDSVSLRAGLTAEWSNDDKVPHTVTSASGQGESFSSGRIKPGQSYSHTFVDTGTHRYRCSLHPKRKGERGKVVVLSD